jgi:FkbM family methyltransferase
MNIHHYINKARSAARENIPDTVRKPVGAFCGRFFQLRLRPILGLLFDIFQGRYSTGGCVFEIPRDQTSLNFRACFFLDDYENEERALIAKHIKAEESVLEYGACIGVVSCTTNKLLSQTSKHVVVEGNPLLISSIAKNRIINNSTFTLCNALASDRTGLLPFHIHPEYIVGGSNRNVGDVVFSVEGMPLATAIERFGRFDALVVDVEGAELELLQAGLDQLPLFRIIIVELHRFVYGTDGEAKCRNLLTKSGFNKVDFAGDTEVWESSQT